MHLGLFVCLSVRMCNSRTIAPIDLICLHNTYYTVAQSSSKMIRIWTQGLFKDSSPLGDRTTYIIELGHVRYDENMRYDITTSESLSSLIALFK